MKVVRWYLIAVVIVLSNGTYGQVPYKKYFPNSEGQLVQHKSYAFDYNEQHEQANWVIYELITSGTTDRTDKFYPDIEVSTHSAQLYDYKGSGYDRGHLKPAADSKTSITFMRESFWLSNVSPQEPGFNRGIWKNLEAQVRKWGKYGGSSEDIIVTGPVLKGENCGKIGRSEVTVPCSYFKIYVDPKRELAIGYVMPQTAKGKLSDFEVTIDEIETKTGIDFFAGMPADWQDKFESEIHKQGLTYSQSGSSYSSNQSSTSSSKNSSSAAAGQCKGRAKSTGVRCKNKTKNASGYCHYHVDQEGKVDLSKTQPTIKKSSSSRCTAITQAGSRCKRTASAGSSRCWQH